MEVSAQKDVLVLIVLLLFLTGKAVGQCYFNKEGSTTVCHCRDGSLYPIPRSLLKCCEGYADQSSSFCEDMLRDDSEGWTRPFTGYWKDGSFVPPYYYEHVCNNAKIPVYRMSPSVDKLNQYGSVADYTNRLRFTDNTIAQEGISFCIVGSHFRKSPHSLWGPLKGFLPLAEKSFDIGNHIDPDDSRKMNTFTLPSPKRLRSIPNEYGQEETNHPWTERNLPLHRFENVWLGIGQVYEAVSRLHKGVPLKTGYIKRPAIPEWQPNPNCQNPYRVKATLIEADGNVLHNYLHITVYSDPIDQPSLEKCPTGRIKMLMLEVRDQDGMPIGQFTDVVHCDKDERTLKTQSQCTNPSSGTKCKVHYGTKRNHMPCMFSDPKSVVHPSIFMFSAEKQPSEGEDSDDEDSVSGQAPVQLPGGGGAKKDDHCRNNQIVKDKRNPPNVKYKKNENQYVTEVHTTWRFAQMDNGWASELHFATMIIEDETPIQYYTSRLSVWDGLSRTQLAVHRSVANIEGGYCDGPITDCCWSFSYVPPTYRSGRIQLGLTNRCVNESYSTNRPYGYSARYSVLKPTFNTRGGWDHFRRDYILPEFVNCHVEISYGKEFYYTHQDERDPDKYGTLPLRATLKRFLDDTYTLQDSKKYEPPAEPHKRWNYPRENYEKTYELPDWHNPGRTMHTDTRVKASERVKTHWYIGKTEQSPIFKMFDSAHQDPIVVKSEFDDKPFREYFGSRYIVSSLVPSYSSDLLELYKTHEGHVHDHEFSMEEMGDDKKSRCPCPYVPTTAPPELATRSPLEIEGRRKHVINMLLAWVVLVPLSYFVTRFYKETYSRVYFLQEFWWFTIHVLSLITALLFTFGGIYSLKVKRYQGGEYDIVWTDATTAHIYMGYILIVLFVIHLLFGAFRFIDPELRIIQMACHWLFGWLEYLCAAGCIAASAAIPSGIMSCTTFEIYCVFIGYQLVFTIGMEIHLRRVDEKLNMEPPRAYFPSPMMRLFHIDAPHAKFRLIMLAIYVIGCFLFYAAMHISINVEGAEFSCFQPV